MIAARPPRRGAAPLLGVLALAGLVACSSGGANDVRRSTPPVESSPPPASPSPSPEPTATGPVSIRAEKQTYGRDEPIVVRLRNASSVDWYATSGRTWCSFLEAQRFTGSAYRAEGACTEGAPPGPVRIPAGADERVELAPGGSNAPLPAGRYRLRLTVSERTPSGSPVDVFSPSFTVTG